MADLETLFLRLCRYLTEQGQELYRDDYQGFRNGVMAFIFHKMGDKDTLLLVSENEEGQVSGFLIGRIVALEPFYKHNLMGRIDWLYPLDLASLATVRKFEAWAKEQGATIGGNFVMVSNGRALEVMEQYGCKAQWQLMVKEYWPCGFTRK